MTKKNNLDAGLKAGSALKCFFQRPVKPRGFKPLGQADAGLKVRFTHYPVIFLAVASHTAAFLLKFE
jgi:hypothetical protein